MAEKKKTTAKKKTAPKRPAQLTERQRRYCEYYIATGKQTESAIKAGYSAKTASSTAVELMAKPHVQEYIAARMATKDKEIIASQDEILSFLTSVMRGDVTEQIPLLDGDGYQRLAQLDAAQPKDRIKAAELLGKRYAMWTEKKEIDADMSIAIEVDYGDDAE